MKPKINKHKFHYEWKLSDGYPAKGIENHKSKVFSCFACGGGSTMGYKLAGYDVIGMNEIDPKMAECYIENHNPKYAFIEPIQDFKNRKDLPKELYDLDILDGSPPCSSFSMAGNREKDWGKKKKFREGQAKQVLDNLFFDFIDLAKELQPKVVVAENVKGLLLGNAKQYVRKIYKEFDKAGYYCQHWLLDASKMGVPQRRERVFFVCLRKDLAEPFLYQQDMFTVNPKLELKFNEKPIKIRGFVEFEEKKETINYSHKRFGDVFLNLDKPANTITSSVRFWLNDKMILKNKSYNLIGSYPTDYKFNSDNVYIIGMSVPPVMTAQIANQIYKQWLNVLKPVCDLSYNV